MAQGKLENFISQKNITAKKVIKGSTLLMGLVLIIFMTVSNVIFDINHLDFFKWLTNSLILVGIMIFGLLMGESIGRDRQTEKKGGLYQTNLTEYNTFRPLIDYIDIYFSQFYLWFKEKELIKKKIGFLIDNSFDGQWARQIVKNCVKSDYDSLISKGEHDKVFEKGEIHIKKATTEEEKQTLKEMFDLKLNAPKYAYFLTAFGSVNCGSILETGTHLNKKLASDKRFNRTIKIVSSLFISLIFGMATTQEFTEGQKMQAWLNLISRLTAFLTSFLSGWGSSVITVKTEAEIIKNKYNVLKDFKTAFETKAFIPENYEQEVERLLQEQIAHTPKVEIVEETPQIALYSNEIENNKQFTEQEKTTD